MSLTTTIKTIQDIMRKDIGVDGDAQRIGQLIWMLFLKIFDEQEKQVEQKNKRYKSPLKDEYRWRNWAAAEENQRDGDDLIRFINNNLFPALKNIESYQGKSKIRFVIQSVFEDAYNYMKSGNLLQQIIQKIEDEIPLRNFEDQQHLGDVYEKLLRDLQSAGNAGEFYTPRAVTHFIIDRVAPRLGETILDPACGTGGFLAQAVDFLNKNNQDDDETTIQKIENAPRGIEKKPLPHMLAVTNMILHGVKEPYRIERKNTLELFGDWPEKKKVDIVVTNPPFGGAEEHGIEADFPAEFQTRETADLFVYFIYSKMLKNGGRCAIVLPDGFLFGEGIKSRIKEDLLEKCNLHTIVRLPKGVFSPYTSINTNILFFEKTGQAKDSTKTIWFYEHPYPEGYKNYSKTRPMQFSEFQPEQVWWQEVYETKTYTNRVETEFSWKIDFHQEKKDAIEKAEPYYQRADEYENQKEQKDSEIKELNTTLKSLMRNREAQKVRISQIKKSIDLLEKEVTQLDLKTKDERSAGDRIKYAVYNLDRTNPNSKHTIILDSDNLLDELLAVQATIHQLQNHLKDEINQILLRNNQ
jgi:type I restriction enzyme M protein